MFFSTYRFIEKKIIKNNFVKKTGGFENNLEQMIWGRPSTKIVLIIQACHKNGCQG